MFTPFQEYLHGRYRLDVWTGCWNWAGSINGCGYGKFQINGRQALAHRASWAQHFGKIPFKMFVCHRCDNPRCVNPDHLFLGNAAANAADKQRKGRGNGGCVSQRGIKLTMSQAAAIKDDPRLHREIAADYGVSRVTVTNIKNGRKWIHLATELAGQSAEATTPRGQLTEHRPGVCE